MFLRMTHQQLSSLNMALKNLLNLVGSSVDTGPGIKNEEFMGLCIGIHDCLEVFFVLFAALPVYPNHGLTAARHRGLAFWMDPRQHLHMVADGDRKLPQGVQQTSCTGEDDWIHTADSQVSFLSLGRPLPSSALHLEC